MKTTAKSSIFYSEFQAFIAPLQDENQTLKQEVQEWKDKYHSLLEQLRLAKQQRFDRSSEAHIGQGELQFDEAESVETAELPQEENTVTVTYTRNKPVRRPLPEHLPREVIEHDIPEEDKLCVCGCMKQRIGEEVTEQLEYIPARLSVIAHVRPKYACNRCDETVSIAPMPSLFLPKSMATPSLVAHAIVSKYEDHLPLYRQEQIWARLGVEMPRNTVCGWIMAAFEVCLPMRAALLDYLIASNYLQADETTMQVMDEPNRKNTSTSYMWVYRNHPIDKKVILFDYQQTRKAQWPKQLLKDFKGYLQTDGYKGYDWVDDHPDIIHLGCWAHARRPFAKLVKLAKTTGKSHQAVAYIKKLYLIEQHARNNHYTAEQRYALRLQQAKPILEQIKAWLDKTIKTTAPQSELGKGLDYMHLRWGELTAYLLDGSLEIDNNVIENFIRPFALGRKNWLVAGSPRGAYASALFIASLQQPKLIVFNPFDYLKTLLKTSALAKQQKTIGLSCPLT
ncbi:IS66 family transposase [Legionella feeleii]|uniref:Transposase n=1 Tax=Legionella feeleii TaxID=453 RepID=A0A2X1RNW7_9GAMM|nr:IS66 family transposase [Legionella feeleii]SPX60089.1 Putative transposase [Legionella feeleii]